MFHCQLAVGRSILRHEDGEQVFLYILLLDLMKNGQIPLFLASMVLKFLRVSFHWLDAMVALWLR